MNREATLTRTFVQLADTLVADFDVVELLTLLADRCVALLDVDAAGLMLVAPDGRLRVMASSSDEMHVLELLELQAEEGPCLDAWHSGVVILDRHLIANRDRWPTFAPAAEAQGFQTVHAVPMRLRGVVIGALNLFHLEQGSLAAADVELARAMADIATIALLQHRASLQAQVLNDQLNQALNTRIAIEQAKGIVAERLKVDVDEAFNQLRSYARSHNRRLADVAEAVIGGVLRAEELGA